jgi:hypothetical protein
MLMGGTSDTIRIRKHAYDRNWIPVKSITQLETYVCLIPTVHSSTFSYDPKAPWFAVMFLPTGQTTFPEHQTAENLEGMTKLEGMTPVRPIWAF